MPPIWSWMVGTQRRMLPLATALFAAIGALVFAFAPESTDPGWSRLSDLGFLFMGPLVAAALIVSLKRLPGEHRRGWMAMAVALSILAAADVTWALSGLTGRQQNYPGPADFAYLIGYLLLFLAVLQLPSRKGASIEWARWLLDAVIGTLAAGLVMWHSYLGDAIAAAATGTTASRIVSVAYPLIGLLNMTGAMVLMVRPTRYVPDRRLMSIGFGLTALVVADSAYFNQIAAGTYWSGNRVNSLWYLWYGAMAVTALLIDRAGPLASDNRRERWWAVAPVYTAVLIMLTHQVTDALSNSYDASLTIGSAAVMGLIILRQTVAMGERRRQVEKHRDDLVASVSHEIRTPLSAIHGFTDIVRDTSLSEDERQDMLETIHEQSSYLTRIVSDLVSTARGSLHREHLTLEPTEVGPLIANAIETAGLEGNVSVHLDAARVVAVDRMRARQILVNLLTNAARYGNDRIEVVVRGSGDRAIIEVHDDGPGVPRRYQDLIWERFERGANRLNGTVPGSGLGLSIVKALIIAHGGTASYRQSERLGGACFCVSFLAAASGAPSDRTAGTAIDA